MSQGEACAVFERAQPLIVPHDRMPAARKMGQRIMWVCMDERALDLAQFAQQEREENELYRQYGGSIHGITTDLMVATEHIKPGTFLDRKGGQYTRGQSRTDVPEMTKRAHLVLLANGLFVPVHDYCASIGLASEVSSSTFTMDPEDLWQRTVEMYPTADQGVFERSLGIHRAMAMQRAFRNHVQGVTEVPVIGMPHVASDIIANHHRGTAFNTYAAIGGDPDNPYAPAYHISFGDMDEVFSPLLAEQEIEVDEVTLKTVAAIRHAALSFQLPQSPLPDAAPLHVHRVGT